MRRMRWLAWAALVVTALMATAVVRRTILQPPQPPVTRPPAPTPAVGRAVPREVPRDRRRSHDNSRRRGPARTFEPRIEPRAEDAGEVSVPAAEPAADPVQEPSPDVSEPPVADTDPLLPQLMVCRPDNGPPSAAAEIIQECINRAPAYSSIEIPPGVYSLNRQVVVSTPLTIRTAGSGGTPLSCAADETQCAVLVAAPELDTQWGPLLVRSTNNVALEHLVIDGNRSARVASLAAQSCRSGDNTLGFNASVLDCLDCVLDDLVSKNAVCGTGMVWKGARAIIRHSMFRTNGDATTGMWSDGLTLLYAPYSVVEENEFVDNSDVALIIGYGVGTRLERNLVRQQTQKAFAGLMLHTWDSDDLRTGGDFRGAVVRQNTIDCGPQLCVFGIQVGPGPWSTKFIIIGGEVHDNEVRGAKVGINVDGAGMRAAPVEIHRNVISAVPADAYFADCARPIATDSMNISPRSVVNRKDDDAPTGAYLSDPCQWSSTLTTEHR